MSKSSQIILTLKNVLKSKGIKYAHVAKHLNISESSIKRQFSQGDISLNRLECICDLAEIEISELLELMHIKSMQVEQLTMQQERKIISNPKLMLVTVSVLNNLSFDKIYEVYNFEKPELIKLLLELEKINLIELKTDNKIKTLISRTFKWQNNGPIQRYFETHIQDDFFNCQFTHAGELRLVINGMISKTSNQILQKKIKQLASTFNDLAYKDQTIGFDKRYGSTIVIAIRPWELQEFDKFRRNKNTKIFR
jgi:DNA-binding Xre family transcriptional regulator